MASARNNQVGGTNDLLPHHHPTTHTAMGQNTDVFVHANGFMSDLSLGGVITESNNNNSVFGTVSQLGEDEDSPGT